MFEPTQKCENNAISKQNYTFKLFIAAKMTYSCCFSFPPKKFITPTAGRRCFAVLFRIIFHKYLLQIETVTK